MEGPEQRPSIDNEFDENSEQIRQLANLTGELAHEIKNPLSTVKVNLKLISEELNAIIDSTSPDKQQRLLARAKRKISVTEQETERVERILSGFLRYVGRQELETAEIDINEIASDMIDFYSPQAQSHSIMIRQNLFSDPLFCKADAAMLKQVLLNLFLNAQQAMAGSGELIIQTDKSDRFAQIRISDTGPGITPEKLEHIFKPFFSSRPGGTGLGLATSKRIIDAHKGNISVTSEPGKGTSFLIELPLLESK